MLFSKGKTNPESLFKSDFLCWNCKHPLIWGSDFDYEDYGLEGPGIVSEFSCSNCPATCTFYLPLGE